jgi:Putative prokaryotic signal transducing protein
MPDDQHSAEQTPRIVATAGSGPEAEMMCQILVSEGIPAMQQRSIDNPEFGAGGPRNVLVKASDLERARDALGLERAQLTHPKGVDAKTSTSYEPVEIPVPKRSTWDRLLHRAENTPPPRGDG